MENLCPSEEEFIESVRIAISEHYRNVEFYDKNNMAQHRDIELGYIKNLEKLLK